MHLLSFASDPRTFGPATKQWGLAYVWHYEALDKKSFQGRLLHILAAVDRKAKFEVLEGDGKKKSLKDEKNAKRKAMEYVIHECRYISKTAFLLRCV